MTHDQMQELLGAYALDATTEIETAEITAHLNDCADCRNEVTDHREVAAMLAVASLDDAPLARPSADLWASISTAVATSSAPIIPITSGRRSSRRLGNKSLMSVVSSVAAVLLIAVVALGVQVQSLNRHVAALRDSTTYSGQLASALLDPSHRSVDLRTSGGLNEATAVLASNGRAFLVNKSLAALAPNKTFQLWALAGGRVVSLGVLSNRPTVEVFRYQPNMTALMISEEPVGGTTTPTTPVVVQGIITRSA